MLCRSATEKKKGEREREEVSHKPMSLQLGSTALYFPTQHSLRYTFLLTCGGRQFHDYNLSALRVLYAIASHLQI